MIVTPLNSSVPIAFFASMSLSHMKDVAQLVKHKIEPKKTGYYAEIGVAKHYRKKHIAYAKDIHFSSSHKKISMIYNVLHKQKLTSCLLARFIILEEKAKNKLCIHPYIYVKNTGAIRYETACGTGSAAVGIFLSEKYQANVYQQSLIQSSGSSVFVSVKRHNNTVTNVKVGDKVKIIFDGKMFLSNAF